MKIFNTLKRKKEVFKPASGRTVGLYTCGPTVYNYAHIGNMRAYLFYDLLKRYLEYRGFDVKHVMNITDVDDKTIRDSKKASMSLKDFTNLYTEAFYKDLETLRIKRANIYPRATEHIQDMVEMIRKLMLRGFAYKSEDGTVYFSIKKFKNYGKLSKLKIKKLKAGARVSQDEYAKSDAQDFALWKAWTEDDGNVFWLTPLGKGRPGWHIECSVMASKYLKHIDIHGGGVDLIFPHHENEIAQYEAATGKKFVAYWIHCNHLFVDGKKMSKSLNNFYTLRDLMEKNIDPVAFRYLCFSAHYRSQLNFTFQSAEKSKNTVDKFNEFLQRIEWMKDQNSAINANHKLHVLIKKTKEDFVKYMDDDMNTPQALAVVFRLINNVNEAIEKKAADRKTLQAVHKFLIEINSIFDIVEKKETGFVESKNADTDFSDIGSIFNELDNSLRNNNEKDVNNLLNNIIVIREKHRKQKNFDEADKIRNRLKERGIILEDTPQGVRWKKV
ncbi:MAG: cysteine--tRNA ligase [Candidatus Aenigmarchaeota archaeon]|nr:cysteine--tRNA ligase [Candidatus Aenigmarchaeota archaeon]